MARRRQWMVGRLQTNAEPASFELICIDDDAQGETISVCLPVEIDAQPITEDGWSQLGVGEMHKPAILGAHLKATEWRTATAGDRRLFQSPFRSGIRLDAYQLLPLKKALALPRVNLLIADDVGLGKTVEAGLIVRELLLRRRIDFIVVSAPASMLFQWQDELAQKFGLDFTIIDRDFLLKTRRERGFAANPWSLGSRFLISHSLLHEESYTGGLRDILGAFRARSLLILDEAHHAAPSAGMAYATESQLTRSVRGLAERFEHRLFLSATPHNGHSNSFATLLEILDPQRFTRGIEVEPEDLEPVMVRRLKEDLRSLGQAFPKRIVDPICIDHLPDNAPELRLAAMLDSYRQNVDVGNEARFLFSLMQQRLFSSVPAFHRTLLAHRRTLAKKLADGERSEDEIDNESSLEIVAETNKAFKGSASLPRAIQNVDEMLEVSGKAKDEPDARVEAILDWLQNNMFATDGSWKDRRLIIFTEWEATRRWLVQCLEEGIENRSGGKADANSRIQVFSGQTSMDDRERIKFAFNAPFEVDPIRILVCTDAAREGINLQTRCHDLIHFDLPWNPSRLEQRNGRIDRKLQPADEVYCRYFSYTQRMEDRVLDALVQKTETIRKELGSAGDVLHTEIEVTLSSNGIRRDQIEMLSRELSNATVTNVEIAKRELSDNVQEVQERLEQLKTEQASLQADLGRAKRRVGVVSEDLQHVLSVALEARGGASLSWATSASIMHFG